MKMFANMMRAGEQMTVGRIYDNYGYGWDSMTADKALMGRAIDFFMASNFVPGVYSGTSTRFDVVAAVRYFDAHQPSYNPGNIPILIMITTNNSLAYGSEMYEIAEENNGRVYAINISDPDLVGGSFDETLSQFMAGTGGFALSGTAVDIWDQFVHPQEEEYINENPDGDSDGLLDWMETGGMKGIDGNVYYSETDTADTDGDIETDAQEMGVCIMIEKSEQGEIIIKIDGEIVTGLFATLLQRYAPQTTGINYVFLVRSNPEIPDTDGDGSDDHVDAKPSRVNDEAIYVLYDPNEFAADAKYWEKKYENEGYFVERIACETILS